MKMVYFVYLGFLVKSKPTQVSWPFENVGSDREDCFWRALVRVILAAIRTLGLRWSLFHLRHHCDIIIVIDPNWAPVIVIRYQNLL